MTEEEKEKLQRRASKLAKDHCDFLKRWFTMVCIDVFKHGFWHGAEEMEKLKEETEIDPA